MTNVVYCNAGAYGAKRRGELGPLMQGQEGQTLTIELQGLDGSPVNVTGYTGSGTLTISGSTVAIDGTLTGANGYFTWGVTSTDSGTAGTASVIFSFVSGGTTYITIPTEMAITVNPAVGASAGEGLQGVTAAAAAWLEASEDAISVGTEDNIVTIDGDGNLQDSGSAAADFLAVDAGIVSVASGRDLTGTDNGKILECNGTFSLNCPDGLGTGFQVALCNIGSGTITVTATTTLQSADSAVTLDTQYAMATLYHRGSNVWLLAGNIA